MAINKVILKNEVKLDLSGDTVTAQTLKKGMTAHDKSGASIVGTMTVPELITYPEQPATCTEDGLTEGIFCNCCNRWLVEREVIAASHVDNNGDGICDICNERVVAEIASGNCGEKVANAYGDNLTWSLLEDYTLEISGTGGMGGCTTQAEQPWKDYSNQIKSVIINNGVTSIGEGAFRECASISSVRLGNDVEVIKQRAFYKCDKLTEIILPNSVREIWGYAFSTCSALTTVKIGAGLETIGNGAFYNDSNISSDLEFSAKLQEIQVSAFAGATKLGNVYFREHTSVPTLGSQYTFPSNATSLKFFVPSNLYDEWKVAKNWSSFAAKIFAL